MITSAAWPEATLPVAAPELGASMILGFTLAAIPRSPNIFSMCPLVAPSCGYVIDFASRRVCLSVVVVWMSGLVVFARIPIPSSDLAMSVRDFPISLPSWIRFGDRFGRNHGDIEFFTTLDPFFQCCRRTELKHYWVPDGPGALPLKFLQRAPHAVRS